MEGARVGLACNQASVDHSFRHAADLFHNHPKVDLTALFGPQHGIRGDVQDNMVETAHAVDRQTNVPIYSLYSETREPTERMLKDVDVIVVDLQGVGCRIYTFAYTMANCMRAAKKFGKRDMLDLRFEVPDGVFESTFRHPVAAHLPEDLRTTSAAFHIAVEQTGAEFALDH